MLGSLAALTDYRPTLSTTNIRGRRLALATTALRSPPMHPEDRLQRTSLLAFLRKDESLAAVRSNRKVAFFDLLEVKEGDTALINTSEVQDDDLSHIADVLIINSCGMIIFAEMVNNNAKRTYHRCY